MTEKQLQQIEQASTHLLVSKAGFSSTAPLEYRYGDERFGGYGFTPLTVFRDSILIQTFIKHLRANSELGQTLRIALAWAQLQAGVGFSILARPGDNIPHLDSRYFPLLRKALYQADTAVQLNNTRNYQSQTTYDRYIMEEALKSKFGAKRLRQINACRLYLRVTTFSDISRPNLQQLDPNVWQGQRPTLTFGNSPRNKLREPR